jgi:hypothetical protein
MSTLLSNPQLSRMSQQDSDTYCRQLFSKMTNNSPRKKWVGDPYTNYRTSYAVGEIDSLKVCPPYLSSRNVNHIWAHRNNGECVANVK